MIILGLHFLFNWDLFIYVCFSDIINGPNFVIDVQIYTALLLWFIIRCCVIQAIVNFTANIDCFILSFLFVLWARKVNKSQFYDTLILWYCKKEKKNDNKCKKWPIFEIFCRRRMKLRINYKQSNKRKFGEFSIFSSFAVCMSLWEI